MTLKLLQEKDFMVSQKPFYTYGNHFLYLRRKNLKYAGFLGGLGSVKDQIKLRSQQHSCRKGSGANVCI